MCASVEPMWQSWYQISARSVQCVSTGQDHLLHMHGYGCMPKCYPLRLDGTAKLLYRGCRSGRKRSWSPDEEGEVSEAEEQTMPVDFHGIVNQAVCALSVQRTAIQFCLWHSKHAVCYASDAKASAHTDVSV